MKRVVSRSFILIIHIFFAVFPAYTQQQTRLTRDTIHVTGHAHMDMNWLWTYSETMKMCQDNLRQAVAFMDEFSDYTMLQSQAAVYRFVEVADPPLFEKVKNYVKEGRLELAGGMWTEGDMNLSSGEAITRSFLLGQRYFYNRFGKMTRTGWLPDNFGHISQMPQILKLSGCDYFYFHRCKPYKGTFWWQGPDGSSVLCYANDTYNGDIKPTLKEDLKTITPGKHRLLHITGVGDHGGGPTRANIDRMHQLDTTPGYPAVKFTTAADFFRKAALEMEGQPVHKGEMQFIFEGCYTNVAEIKAGNRNSENALYANEFLNTLSWLRGGTYPADELRDLWTTLVFNQFHDILPGSAIYEANREAVARYTELLRKSGEMTGITFRKLADQVKFRENMGQPVVAFNLHPFAGKTLVEAEIWSHQEPATAKLAGWGNYYGSKYITPVDKGQGKCPSILVRDGSGKSYPAQVVWGKSTPPGFTSKVLFVADNLPAGGYKTFYADMARPGEFNESIPLIDNTFETDFFRVRFDMTSGSIISLVDKRTNKEFVRKGGKLNTLRMYLEDKKGGMKSWVINKITGIEEVTKVSGVKVVENGPVRACVESVKTWGKSRFIERTYIYRSYPRIDYDMEVHWLETGSDTTDSPMLKAIFPLNIDQSRLYCQVPFDVVERPVDGKVNGTEAPATQRHADAYGIEAEKMLGQEVPAQHWVDVNDGSAGLALLNRTKYGHALHNGELSITLMRSAGEPDIYPNLGKFTIHYALFPHSGDWKNGVWAEGNRFNVPVFAAEPPSLALGKEHATLPEEMSFISLDGPGVIFSGMKKSEDGNELVVRLAEVEGKESVVTLNLPVTVTSARRLNLVEMPLPDVAQPLVNGKSVRVKIRPHEIVTQGISVHR